MHSSQGTLKQVPLAPYIPDESVARPQWYDRNPLVVFNSFDAIVTKGTWTDRLQWTYTVPINRKFFLEYLVVTLNISAAPSAGDEILAYITYTPAGQTGGSLIKLLAIPTTTQLSQTQQIGQSLLLFAADNLSAYTTMPNETNTVLFLETMKGTEFDA